MRIFNKDVGHMECALEAETCCLKYRTGYVELRVVVMGRRM
jgi:hypothetical protein